MSESEVHAGPVVTVARHLSEIVALAASLEDQAVHKANDPLMPGGLAMVALADVANLEAWGHKLETAERTALAYGADLPTIEDDDDWEPPLQTLLFWSEQWRVEHGMEYGKRATLASEANFIRWALDWAWDNEAHWDDFADDIETAHRRLEALVVAGSRPAFSGAPCLYDECRGARLIRKTVPTRDKDGNKVWRLTDWHCPRCKRSWSEEDYTRNLYAAIARDKVLYLIDETWCTVDHATMRVNRPQGTIRSWASRGEVASFCTTDDRRRTFVNLADVVERDRLARKRYAAWVEARRRRLRTTAV